MGKRKKIGLLLIWLVCGAALMGGSIGVQAADVDDAAKQLMAPGWEVLPAPGEEPVIIYELSLVELRSQMGRVIEASAEYSKGEDVQGGYTIITDDALLNLVGDFPASFTLGVSGGYTSSTAAFEYKTWLVTMGDQPVSIEVIEDTIAAAGGEEGLEYGLRIALTPRYYDEQGGGVLTEVDLEYASPANAVGNTRITGWLSAEKQRPLAVIVQDIKYTKELTQRYFALYASAEVMSPRALADQGPVVSIGSIKGLQELMAKPRTGGEAATQGQIWIGAGVMDGRIGTSGGVLMEGESSRLHVRAAAFPSRVAYTMGGAWYVVEELGLAAHVDGRTDGDTLIRCGLTDHVRWGDVEIRAEYLPIAYSADEGRFVEAAWMRCSAAVDLNNWRFRYDLTYDRGEIGHELAVMRRGSADVGVSLQCAQLPTKESVYTLGLVFWLD